MCSRFFRFAALATLLLLTLAACGPSGDDAGDGSADSTAPRVMAIAGTLSYEEEITLAPESLVTVQLIDVSRADEPAGVVAEKVFLVPGKPPLPFRIEYAADRIEDGHRYSLRAEVKEQKRLMFVSDAAYPVLRGKDQAPVDILLKRVPAGRVERMAENVRASNPELSGFYRYYDGHGEFTDCSDDSVHPVAREEAVFSLESEYRDVAPRYGDEVYVRLIGKYTTRAARSGRGKEDYLVVLQVEEMDADGDCP